jgi:hypothetical protein
VGPGDTPTDLSTLWNGPGYLVDSVAPGGATVICPGAPSWEHRPLEQRRLPVLNPDVGGREVQVMVVWKESWCEGRAAGVAGIRSGGCTVTLSDQLAVLATAVAG